MAQIKCEESLEELLYMNLLDGMQVALCLRPCWVGMFMWLSQLGEQMFLCVRGQVPQQHATDAPWMETCPAAASAHPSIFVRHYKRDK